MIRSLDELLPEVKAKAEKFLAACKDAGIGLIVTGTYRSIAEQDDIYAQGRTKPGDIVTHAHGGESWHNYRRAFDVAFFDGKRVSYRGDWRKLGEIGKQCGLEWGGDWPQGKRDQPHFQDRGDMTLAQAQKQNKNSGAENG